MMEFSGEFTVDGAPEELWKYFTDPDILRDCAPGCNKMELESPSHIVAGLTVGVGSVKPSFDVEGVVTVCDRPNRLEIEAAGEASRNSFEVTAWQELQDNGDGTTTVTWQANAEISGIIASLGERAIGSVADKLVNEFFQELEEHANAGTPAESKLRAASGDQPDTAEQLASDSTTTGGDLAGTTVGTVREVATGDGPSSGQSFAAGVVFGLLGSSLLRRLRNRGEVETAQSDESAASAENPPPSSSTSGGSSSWVVLALAAALGAAGALAWRQIRSDGTAAQVDSGGSGVTSETESAPEMAEEASTTEPTEERGQAPDTNDKSDNPLDRLESRP